MKFQRLMDYKDFKNKFRLKGDDFVDEVRCDVCRLFKDISEFDFVVTPKYIIPVCNLCNSFMGEYDNEVYKYANK